MIFGLVTGYLSRKVVKLQIKQKIFFVGSFQKCNEKPCENQRLPSLIRSRFIMVKKNELKQITTPKNEWKFAAAFALPTTLAQHIFQITNI